MSFSNAQIIFKRFKEELDKNPEVRDEFQDALKKVIEFYNTTIYENRFVVGGIVEYIVAATFNAFDCFRATHIGKSSQRTDIKVSYNSGGSEITAEYSIKGAFTKTISTIILINFQGAGEGVDWDEPTIFVLAQNGIFYADQEILPGITVNRGDSLTIKFDDLKKHSDNAPEYHIDVDIPVKPGTEKAAGSRVASEDLAKTLLENYKRLKI